MLYLQGKNAVLRLYLADKNVNKYSLLSLSRTMKIANRDGVYYNHRQHENVFSRDTKLEFVFII